jgi:hypothetical protein
MYKMAIIDLTNYTMQGREGLQYFSEEEAKDRIFRYKLPATARKDERPKWATQWRQTWTLVKQ